MPHQDKFIHLHTHTEYSLLDGACRIPDLVARAKELGMSALAVTDHGNMYAAIEFYLKAKEEGLKPIIGCEMYVAPRTSSSEYQAPADRLAQPSTTCADTPSAEKAVQRNGAR